MVTSMLWTALSSLAAYLVVLRAVALLALTRIEILCRVVMSIRCLLLSTVVIPGFLPLRLTVRI